MSGARFSSVLVANRGEIAVRVMRTAREMGLRTVAVYSSADADAPHVAMADQAICIGPATAAQSYLNIAALLKAAEASGAGAIHPGYGFLSENADFARAVEAAGLVFVGPSPDAIEAMGDKAKAKRRMQAAGVPCVPGYEGAAQDDATLIAEAARIGFPVMVKAAAGGGGKGMRLVTNAPDLPEALLRARAEARAAFGNDHLILEQAIQRPRHVEIQVMADAHGAIIHLGERDCSVQRRHQKVIEEAPGPAVDAPLRARMGAAAVAAAKAVGYRGAGTVEFLLDETGAFYFLEMNTRLQVEHPVTELITGLDLVALQFSVAQGAPLPVAQDDICLNGHAIEARLYAEDPANDFLPATGTVALWQPGPDVRVDSGIATGSTVSPHYDPMLAKIIAHGPTRDAARRALIAGLEGTAALGLTTNGSFLQDILRAPGFAQGAATTSFLDEAFPEGWAPEALPQTAIACAAGLLLCSEMHTALDATCGSDPALIGFSSDGGTPVQMELEIDGTVHHLTVIGFGNPTFRVDGDAGTSHMSLGDISATNIRAKVDGTTHNIVHAPAPGGGVFARIGGRHLFIRRHRPWLAATDAQTGGQIVAPMPGLIAGICVSSGDRVQAGQTIAILEAMKMQHRLSAPTSGVVANILTTAGQQVTSGTVIAILEEDT